MKQQMKSIRRFASQPQHSSPRLPNTNIPQPQPQPQAPFQAQAQPQAAATLPVSPTMPYEMPFVGESVRRVRSRRVAIVIGSVAAAGMVAYVGNHWWFQTGPFHQCICVPPDTVLPPPTTSLPDQPPQEKETKAKAPIVKRA